ncbi:sensor histidine kinase [Parafilimonas terrae]|uniref:Histidine kinase n=1 Tax=Parafilimonas terrae TaxID=1465490 RepID=A0A1I5RWC8_9BACT|nr:sensor histidine kinase [Parafilimonas terrae]SFP62838.1 Histidine kinase [Parafilimonas terrae]
MEFDNDRPVKHTGKIEIFCWVLLALMNPLINCLTFFLHNAKIWWFVFGVNLLMLPAYIFYSAIIVPRFLHEKKYVQYFSLTILFLAAIQLILFGIYSIIWDFGSQTEQAYFTYSFSTIIRECLWSIIYTLIAIAIYFINKAFDERKLLIALQKDNDNFRLKYLRAQLNPHFLFNTLNSIYSLSMQKSDETPGIVLKLADLMRYLIYECNEEKVPLTKEIEFIRNYIELEKVRYNADIRFDIEGDSEGIMIEPLLFISFVENGFKHAFDSAYANAFIYITLKITPEQITLTVINNTSIDLETQARRIQGTGIRTSKNMLELLYPTSHALHIIQTEKEESRSTELRMQNARRRLENLYPDSHTLDVILSNNTFTVSLILKRA